MILKLLKYFAQYPQKEGVISMFSNGASRFPQYSALLEYVKGLPAPFMPALENLVFGQSYDDVKRRVDDITGNYLSLILENSPRPGIPETPSWTSRSWRLPSP